MKTSNFKKIISVLVATLLLLSILVGCGSENAANPESSAAIVNSTTAATSDTSSGNSEKKVIRYSLWDQNQAPAYQQIIDNFIKENPDIDVQMELTPWADYWTKLTTQASGGSCPDLITMFVLQFKTLQTKNVLAVLNDYIEKDNLDMSKYNPTAVDTFTVNGNIYGLPKDFDSIATFYNKDILKKAGYEEYPTDLKWDAATGGTYVKFLQSLTLDNKGKHPNESGFDPKNIVQYGLLPIDRADYSIDGILSTVITENGGRFFNPESGALTFDEPKAFEALQFIDRLTNEWYVCPPVSVIQSTGAEALFYSQVAATWLNGPWMTSAVQENTDFEWSITRNFVGPTGKSVSRANSLIDCIYEQSKNKDAAWKLLEYIATKPGQDILGETGTVIPAYSDSSSKYVEYYKNKGIDVSVFIDAYNGDTVFPPNLSEFPRADDISMRNFALLLSGEKKQDLETTVKNIMNEASPILDQAN